MIDVKNMDMKALAELCDASAEEAKQFSKNARNYSEYAFFARAKSYGFGVAALGIVGVNYAWKHNRVTDPMDVITTKIRNQNACNAEVKQSLGERFDLQQPSYEQTAIIAQCMSDFADSQAFKDSVLDVGAGVLTIAFLGAACVQKYKHIYCSEHELKNRAAMQTAVSNGSAYNRELDHRKKQEGASLERR